MSLDIVPKKPKRVGFALSKYGALICFGGIAFAFSPIALAIISTPPGGNPFSEGGGGGGAAIWLMIATLPLGGFASIAGLLFMISGISYTLKTKSPEDPTLQAKTFKEKSISLALIVPALMLVMPVLSFVFGNMIVGPYAAEVTIFVTTGLALAAIVMSLIFAIKSKLQKFLIVMIVLAVIAVAGLSYEAFQLYWTFRVFNG